MLRPPNWDKSFHVFCDASNVAVGSALCQSMGEKGKDQPIAYTSKQLTPAERNYSTTEKECLAYTLPFPNKWSNGAGQWNLGEHFLQNGVGL